MTYTSSSYPLYSLRYRKSKKNYNTFAKIRSQHLRVDKGVQVRLDVSSPNVDRFSKLLVIFVPQTVPYNSASYPMGVTTEKISLWSF